LKSGQRRPSYVGAGVEERTLMAGRSRAGQQQGTLAAIDEKAWAGPRRLGPGRPGRSPPA